MRMFHLLIEGKNSKGEYDCIELYVPEEALSNRIWEFDKNFKISHVKTSFVPYEETAAGMFTSREQIPMRREGTMIRRSEDSLRNQGHGFMIYDEASSIPNSFWETRAGREGIKS